MALRYPFLTIIVLIVVALAVAAIAFLVKGRKEVHVGGARVANVSFAKSLPAAQSRARRRKIIFVVLQVLVAVSLVISSVLIARPSSVKATSSAAERKDIMLCLDVSSSICSMNYDIVDTLKDIVGSLGGERFGITIYNTSAVLYVPLTDDYAYIQDALEELKELFRAQEAYMTDDVFSWHSVDTDTLWYFEEGTINGAEEKGSSLIGEGLASAMYSFPGLGEKGDDRTRLIIMSTDNAEEQGDTPPLIRFPEAAEKCAENGIKILGISPSRYEYYYGNSVPYETAIREFTEGVEETGGKVYQTSRTSSASEIIKEINEQESALVQSDVKITYEDEPVLWYIIIVSGMALVLCGRAVSRL